MSPIVLQRFSSRYSCTSSASELVSCTSHGTRRSWSEAGQRDAVAVRCEDLTVAHDVALVGSFALQRRADFDRFDLALEDPRERPADEALEATFEPLRQGSRRPPPDGISPARVSAHVPTTVLGGALRPANPVSCPCYRFGWPISRARNGAAPGKWRNGRRARFRSVCPKGRGGSTPPLPTPAHHGVPRSPARTPAGFGPPRSRRRAAAGERRARPSPSSMPTTCHRRADLALSRASAPPCTTANGCFRKVNQNGGTTPPAPNAGWGRDRPDLDMVSAACPNCKILLVEANSASNTNLARGEPRRRPARAVPTATEARRAPAKRPGTASITTTPASR